MRAHGLSGPLFARHAGNRASHPLANPGAFNGEGGGGGGVDINQSIFVTCMTDQGWDVIVINALRVDIVGTGGNHWPITAQMINTCDFSSLPSAIANDALACTQAQGKCL